MAELHKHTLLPGSSTFPSWTDPDPWSTERALPFRWKKEDLFASPSNNASQAQTTSPARNWLPTSPGEAAHDLTFLDDCGNGDATIIYFDEHGSQESIRNISSEVIGEASALLSQALEPTRNGYILTLDLLSSVTAPGFVRFLYTRSYAPDGLYDDVPTSILLHCQMYHVADVFDMPDLKTQAYVNTMRQCEFGCSSPDRPIDLCAAIEFCYQNLRDSPNVIDLILNYCVSCFSSHKLTEDEDFRRLAYDSRDFVQDLSRTVMQRGFEDDTAQAIIQMQSKPFVPETYASREDIPKHKMDDIVFRYHAWDEYDNPRKRRKRSISEETQLRRNTLVDLPIRTERAHIKQEVVADENEQESATIEPFREAKTEVVADENKQDTASTEPPHEPKTDLQLSVKIRRGTTPEIQSSQIGHGQKTLGRLKVEEELEFDDIMFSSDSEYDMVSRPAEVEALSSSNDSESEFEKIGNIPRGQIARSTTTSTMQHAGSESDAESDWSLIEPESKQD